MKHDKKINTKEFFDALDLDKKKKKKSKKDSKKSKDNEFGFDLDVKDKKKKSKKDSKKKNNKSDKNYSFDIYSVEYEEEKPKKVGLGDSKFSRKLLKKIKSSQLREDFKRDKALIDTKKFWTRD